MTKILRKILNKIPKRYIYNRTNDKLYMIRYYLFLKNRKRFPFNITLHRISLSDDPYLHDHPWPYFTLILWGGYWEHTAKGTFWRGIGHFRFRKSTSLHWLELDKQKPCWSLFIMGKQKRNWGFIYKGEWIPHEKYLKMREEMKEDGIKG